MKLGHALRFAFVAALAALATAACGSSPSPSPGASTPATSAATPDAPAGDPPAPSSSSPSPAPSPGAATPSAACAGAGAAAKPGDVDWTIASGGANRTVHVHVPPSYAPATPIPVVLDFHGYLSTGTQEAALSGMNDKGDEVGFVAIHPEGTNQSWNAGTCCGDAVTQKIDDVGFVGAILDKVESTLCVDTRRIFATGMSNGGFLAHRLACELGDRVAAVAPVAGDVGVSTCAPKRPMSVYQFHGTSDPVVPWGGNPLMGYPAVPGMMDDWAARSGCQKTSTTTLAIGDVTCTTYDGCTGGSEISLCKVDGGGHTWPGGQPMPTLGMTTTDIKATDVMWEFFTRHPL